MPDLRYHKKTQNSRLLDMLPYLRMVSLAERALLVVALGTLLLVSTVLSTQNAFALLQIAGKIEVALAPGESQTVRWGLISDSDEDIELNLISEGIGAEFLAIPPTALIPARETKYIDVMISIPEDHPGDVALRPYVQATQAGEPGQVVVNVGLRKYIDILIGPNPNSVFRTLQMKSFENRVVIDGKEVVLKIESTSDLSDFVLDYEKNQISFIVSGLGGTNGTALVPIGQVLEGPHSVLIDDVPVTNFETVDDAGTTTISLHYRHSAHKITITGASVVPEFSVVSMGIISTAMLVIVLAWRHQVLRRLI